jgi:hypothetical protein
MKTKIFVYMLNEGTDVWRPVEAEKENEFFRILTVRDIEDEEWEFNTGDLVRCENKIFQSGITGLVAVQKINIY